MNIKQHYIANLGALDARSVNAVLVLVDVLVNAVSAVRHAPHLHPAQALASRLKVLLRRSPAVGGLIRDLHL